MQYRETGVTFPEISKRYLKNEEGCEKCEHPKKLESENSESCVGSQTKSRTGGNSASQEGGRQDRKQSGMYYLFYSHF